MASEKHCYHLISQIPHEAAGRKHAQQHLIQRYPSKQSIKAANTMHSLARQRCGPVGACTHACMQRKYRHSV